MTDRTLNWTANMEKCSIRLLNEHGLTTIEGYLDILDTDMLRWTAQQYAECSSAQVTITNLEGDILTFTGETTI